MNMNIETETVGDVVGEAHSDAWNNNSYRLQMDGKPERNVTKQELEAIALRRNLSLIKNGNSGHSFKLVKENEIHWCRVCENKAMFDGNGLEWYCPICENQ